MANQHDRAVLRSLAARVAEIAQLPEMAARRDEWRRHNGLRPGRPMILVFPEGSWSELIPPSSLQCQEERYRRMELDLRQRIYAFQHFHS
ncbi:MAG: hypothetical protein QHJ73_18895, partial [Armatimonadota bacterium]|nr:hypothetical protein [Armatimonadota bacterium]